MTKEDLVQAVVGLCEAVSTSRAQGGQVPTSDSIVEADKGEKKKRGKAKEPTIFMLCEKVDREELYKDFCLEGCDWRDEADPGRRRPRRLEKKRILSRHYTQKCGKLCT